MARGRVARGEGCGGAGGGTLFLRARKGDMPSASIPSATESQKAECSMRTMAVGGTREKWRARSVESTR